MTDKYYVVGDWKSGKEQCPLSKAQLDGHKWANELAEEFDSCARAEFDLERGVTIISGEDASEVWNYMVHLLESRIKDTNDDEINEMHTEMFKLAEEVQRKLNWV